ncbi:MAG: hypothetical protein QOJ44_916 [Acidimicrobiaceae bacterium]|jgi:hypothetical protein|nr:hypothetical protein [Acidimicrobiaceae bacterium]
MMTGAHLKWDDPTHRLNPFTSLRCQEDLIKANHAWPGTSVDVPRGQRVRTVGWPTRSTSGVPHLVWPPAPMVSTRVNQSTVVTVIHPRGR